MDHFNSELVKLIPRLRRFAYSLARVADRADDLVQATCERAISRRAQFKIGTRMDSWLFAIMKSIWLNEIRSDLRRGAGSEPVDPDLLSDARSEGAGEARVELSKLDEMILTLPEAQREALMIVSVEGLSYAEAAETLGVAIGTIMSRVSRARLALMQMRKEAA